MGTSFKVCLPRVEEEVHRARPDAQFTPRPVQVPKTILLLLVEDEDSVRTLAQRILKKNGYAVLEAQNGAESLRLCEQHAGPIDLLITDVVMPELSGPQTVERLSTVRREMKILDMSGYTDMPILKPVLDTNTPFLQKPFTAQALVETVQALLNSQRGSQEQE